MEYNNFMEAVFLARPNRFVAKVLLAGEETFVHVPNTGRCREILVPGRTVYLMRSGNEKRKYPYTLTSVYKGKTLVNIDSAGANRVAAEALDAGKIHGLEAATAIRREVSFAHSRFDIAFRQDHADAFMEVKGVTLETNGKALFPDAPTERGTRHLRELILAKEDGYNAYVLFIVQMQGVRSFSPHKDRDPAFTTQLQQAAKAGVMVLAYDTVVTPAGMTLNRAIPVLLES